MTILNLAESVVTPLMKAIAPPDAIAAEDERFARIFLSIVAEPGDADMGHLVRALGAVKAAELLLDEKARGILSDEAIARWTARLSTSNALLASRQANRFGIVAVVPGDAQWPAQLDDLGDQGPTMLWCRGNVSLLQNERRIAIVGARAATGYGEHVTVEVASGLADRGFTIVSGAAYGIDGIAHRAALASTGSTVAFLAGGADRFYPAGHEALLTRIVERGLVVSEVAPGTAPTKWRFLQRNRLIAAFAEATVVVEAGYRSGSLNTAGHAKALGRPVGAVPGPVTSAASAGTHRLIADEGAKLVTDADTIAVLVPSYLPASAESVAS